MKSPLLHGLSLAALTAMVSADEPLPARLGLQLLEERFGRAAIERLFEMTGSAGDPQPTEWRIMAHDPKRSDLLHEYWLGDRRATDEGVNDDFYPDRLPKGFFALSRVKLDSTQAFAIAEQIARDAGIGFDAINYKLHCREYSDEPVWTLTVLDKEGVIVGSIHLSADSGKVLRTVWLRRLANGRLSVEDSAIGAPSKRLAAVAPEPVVPGAPDAPAPVIPEPEAPGDDTVETTPAPPATVPAPAAEDEEIPEIKRLNEAQEKAKPTKP